LALASSVSAHTIMFGVSVNGVDQGNGQNVYIRSPPNNSPVKELQSPDLICGVNGAKAAPEFVKAAGGDTLTFEWFHDSRNDDIVDPSHKGPIITYVAPYTSGAGTGPIWTKIAESGLSGGQWAVDKLIANNGKIDIALPNLVAGKYLVRQEIIALHEADADVAVNPSRGAQFYPSCVQLEVTGSGTVVPNQNFDINSYTSTDPGLFFDLYTKYSSYTIPGPAVFTG
ncbi:glycoside hydrolase, partial [Cercophora newfieldiana]